MNIEDINPWWKTGRIADEYAILPKRDLFDALIDYIKEKQVIAINGIRRTGKTVLMFHIIKDLLEKFPKQNILYYSFDLFNDSIENILKSYKEQLGIDFKKDNIFVFLDEIQKHNNWENELKLLYDNYSNIKFFISGSSSLFIEKKTKESLGGRVFSFILEPLSFKEYLKLKNIKIDNIQLYKDEIKGNFQHYIRTGGFPELLNTTEEPKINRYIKELVVDRVVYIDIPNVFKIEEPELLAKILSIISANPGMIIDYDSLADDLNRNRKTISNYIFYLEKAYLIKKLYNYSRNLLTSEKKMKKIYPISTIFAYLFNADQGKIIENTVLMNGNFKFFSRIARREVDFIGDMPIEVKYTKKVKRKEIKGLIRFIEEFNFSKGVVITDDYEKEEIIGNKKIVYIPLWKWLLEG